MDLQNFIQHARSEYAPERYWPPSLQALWYAERGEWDTAHTRCQEGDAKDGAWVHANLHREEGDLSNARYWYHRADKEESDLSIEDERHQIIEALLQR